ncbi:MAG: hypothetical protein LBI13_05090 [Streptococcaceae bacterium]|jgi:hypothetical protein|nr:hypothetical protein [Streptococcaceae bacterium]
MKFEFKGISSFEEKATPNFMGEADSHSVIKEFENIDSAIQYVNFHQGFMVTDNGKFAFVVRNIKEVR